MIDGDLTTTFSELYFASPESKTTLDLFVSRSRFMHPEQFLGSMVVS